MKTSRYGLPEKVEHCSNCLMTNQKPFSINESKSTKKSLKKGLLFNKDKICLACEYNDKKNKIECEL